jgi:hypothetical protein
MGLCHHFMYSVPFDMCGQLGQTHLPTDLWDPENWPFGPDEKFSFDMVGMGFMGSSNTKVKDEWYIYIYIYFFFLMKWRKPPTIERPSFLTSN